MKFCKSYLIPSQAVAEGKFISTIMLYVIFAFVSCAIAQEKAKPSTDSEILFNLKNKQFKNFNKSGIPSVVISAIHSSGKVEYQKFGVIDYQSSRQADENSIYKIASLSKVFTSIAILKLDFQGKIKLDEPIGRLFPEFEKSENSIELSSITIRELLCHASGLPRGGIYAWYPNSGDSLIIKMSKIRLLSKPGSQFSYSNIGYSLLGEIIRRVTHIDPREYIRSEIISPLKLTRTGYLSLITPNDNIAQGYPINRGLGYEESLGDFDGGMFSTAHDLSLLAKYILGIEGNNGEINLDILSNKYRLSSYRPESGYCPLGNYRIANRDTTPFKDGIEAGYSSGIFFDKKLMSAIVILSNTEINTVSLGINLINSMSKNADAKCEIDTSNEFGIKWATTTSDLKEFSGEYFSKLYLLDGRINFESFNGGLRSRSENVGIFTKQHDHGWNTIGIIDSAKKCWLFFYCKSQYYDKFAFLKVGDEKFMIQQSLDQIQIVAETNNTLQRRVIGDDLKAVGNWSDSSGFNKFEIFVQDSLLFIRDQRIYNGSHPLPLERVSAFNYRISGSYRDLDFSIQVINDELIDFRHGIRCVKTFP